MSVLLFAALSSVSLTVLVLCISLFGFTLGLSLPLQTALLSAELSRLRATANGVYNFFRYQGMTIGPVLGAYYYPYGNAAIFYVLTAIYIVALVFICNRIYSKTAAGAAA